MCKSVDVHGVNVGFLIKTSQLDETNFICYYIRNAVSSGLCHIVQRWQIPRDCRVCPALASVKHKCAPADCSQSTGLGGSLT